MKLTFLDYISHGNLVEQAKKQGQKALCWMVTREDLREQERQKVLANFNESMSKAMGIPLALTEETFDRFIFSKKPEFRNVLKQWVETEEEYQKMREENNPKAWFVHQEDEAKASLGA